MSSIRLRERFEPLHDRAQLRGGRLRVTSRFNLPTATSMRWNQLVVRGNSVGIHMSAITGRTGTGRSPHDAMTV
jgi:hypothetical protein